MIMEPVRRNNLNNWCCSSTVWTCFGLCCSTLFKICFCSFKGLLQLHVVTLSTVYSIFRESPVAECGISYCDCSLLQVLSKKQVRSFHLYLTVVLSSNKLWNTKSMLAFIVTFRHALLNFISFWACEKVCYCCIFLSECDVRVVAALYMIFFF